MSLLTWISRKFAKPSPQSPPRQEVVKPDQVTSQPPRPQPVAKASPAPNPAPQAPPPTPLAQPSPRHVSSDTTLRLPWLAPLDNEREKLGMSGIYAHVEAPAGSTVYVDAASRKARIIYPDQRVRAWDGFKVLDVRPDKQTWMMSWNLLNDLKSPRIIFNPMDEYNDDEIVQQTGFEFYAEDIEGSERTYWPEFVKMVKDPFLNPAGFPLRSGVYVHAFVSFNLNFGEDGSTPSMEPAPETLPPTLDFPYRTNIGVTTPFVFEGQKIGAGWYTTKVMGYRTDTGHVTDIVCKGVDHSASFRLDGDQMVQFIHEGKFQLGEVLEDRMPNF